MAESELGALYHIGRIVLVVTLGALKSLALIVTLLGTPFPRDPFVFFSLSSPPLSIPPSEKEKNLPHS